ncbi:hypothetical protein V8E53_009832 [Lactarius tabidus]
MFLAFFFMFVASGSVWHLVWQIGPPRQHKSTVACMRALEATRSMFKSFSPHLQGELIYRTRTHSMTSNVSDALVYFPALFAACSYCRRLGLLPGFPLQLRGRLCYAFYPSARQSYSPPRTPAISSSSSFRETTPSRGKIAEGKISSPILSPTATTCGRGASFFSLRSSRKRSRAQLSGSATACPQ